MNEYTAKFKHWQTVSVTSVLTNFFFYYDQISRSKQRNYNASHKIILKWSTFRSFPHCECTTRTQFVFIYTRPIILFAFNILGVTEVKVIYYTSVMAIRFKFIIIYEKRKLQFVLFNFWHECIIFMFLCIWN